MVNNSLSLPASTYVVIFEHSKNNWKINRLAQGFLRKLHAGENRLWLCFKIPATLNQRLQNGSKKIPSAFNDCIQISKKNQMQESLLYYNTGIISKCLKSNLHLAETLHNCYTVLAKNFKIWHQIKFWEAIVSFWLNLMAYCYSSRQQYKIKATVRKLERHLSKAVSVGKISIKNSFKSCSLKLQLSIHI